MALLLRGGRLVDPAVGMDQIADVIIRDGVIVEIGADLSIPKGVTVECAEKVVLPGLIDIHTHLREPGYEYKEDIASGTRAAAHGGFTAVAAMPNTLPVCDEGSAVRFLVERAAERGVVRVLPIGAITVGSQGKALAEMGDMLAEGAVAFSDDGQGVQDAGMMRLAMEYALQFDAVIVSHCEVMSLARGGVVNEGAISTRLGLPGHPAVAEEIQAERDIALSELTGCRLHLAHISTARTVNLVRQAKVRGVRVTAEVTPHHLFLSEDDVGSDYPTSLKMNPPLRTRSDCEALIAGLVDGTIDAIATDHAPHALHEKALEFELAPFGTTGLETAVPLVVTNLLRRDDFTWDDMVRVMAHGPRRALGIGSVELAPGAVADITVIDPEAKVDVTAGFFASNSANSAFLGATLLGKASEVLVGGRFALRNGKVVD